MFIIPFPPQITNIISNTDIAKLYFYIKHLDKNRNDTINSHAFATYKISILFHLLLILFSLKKFKYYGYNVDSCEPVP